MKRRAIFIFGPHRAGTSALASLLKVAGIHLGDRLLAAAADNLGGFYEDADMVGIDDHLLSLADSSWLDPLPLDIARIESALDEETRGRMRNVLRRLSSEADVIGAKDPRLSLLLPLWVAAARAEGFSVHGIVAVRDPVASARSLRARDGLGLEHALLLGHKYLTSAQKYRGLLDSVATIAYEDLLADPAQAVRRLCADLGLPMIGDLDPASLTDAVVPAWRHHGGKEDDSSLPRDTLRLRAFYHDLVRGGLSAAAPALPADASLAGMALAQAAERQFRVTRKLQGDLHQLTQFHLAVSNELSEQRSLLRDVEERAKLAKAELAAARQEIDALRASHSWRTTAPLRAAGDGVRAARRRSRHLARRAALALWRRLPMTARSRRRLAAGLRRLPGANRALALLRPDVPAGLVAVVNAGGVQRARGDEHVSIVVCVHNALDDVKRCLRSVMAHSSEPCEIILVDDGSDAMTQSWLQSAAKAYGAVLLRNDEALGYTRAANLGMKHARGDFLVLLNSDTVVFPGWLDGMLSCARASARVGIVGPLSNTASWQSVPDVFGADGDWSDNAEALSISGPEEFAALLVTESPRVYPRLPFLNGFCLMIRRDVVDSVGVFDEELFGQGYGEENDYCIRVRAAGWQLAVADDTFVFHAQSRSYSHAKRLKLVERSDRCLIEKHGAGVMAAGAAACRDDLPLAGVRQRMRVSLALQDPLRSLASRLEGMRVAVLLPVADEGGGGHVVLQEFDSLAKLGVDCRIVNLEVNRAAFERSFPRHPARSMVWLGNEQEVRDYVWRRELPFDAVVMTASYGVPWIMPKPDDSRAKAIYYIQDFEPWFYPEGSVERDQASQSYLAHPELTLVTKTRWTRDLIVGACRGAVVQLIGPSVDTGRFAPRPLRQPMASAAELHVAAMIRPSTPRRAPARTLEVLGALQRADARLQIHTFGCEEYELASIPAARRLSAARHVHHGRLHHDAVSELLARMHLFIDLSDFQAMGLTALEAMACGVAVFAPMVGGAVDFIKDGDNAFLLDSLDAQASSREILRRIADPVGLDAVAARASSDVARLSPDAAALSWGELLCS